MGRLATEFQSLLIDSQVFSRVRFLGGFHRHDQISWLAMVIALFKQPQMSTEVRNWDVVAKALEAAGNTSSEMYIRAAASKAFATTSQIRISVDTCECLNDATTIASQLIWS